LPLAPNPVFDGAVQLSFTRAPSLSRRKNYSTRLAFGSDESGYAFVDNILADPTQFELLPPAAANLNGGSGKDEQEQWPSAEHPSDHCMLRCILRPRRPSPLDMAVNLSREVGDAGIEVRVFTRGSYATWTGKGNTQDIDDVIQLCRRALAEQHPLPRDPLVFFNNHMRREIELRLEELRRMRQERERRESEAANQLHIEELEVVVLEARPSHAAMGDVASILEALEADEFNPATALASLLKGAADFRTLFEVVRCASPTALRALMRHAIVHQPLEAGDEHLGRVLDLALKTHADAYRKLFAQHRSSRVLADAHLHCVDVFAELEREAFSGVTPLLAVHPGNFDRQHLECKALDFRNPEDGSLLEGPSLLIRLFNLSSFSLFLLLLPKLTLTFAVSGTACVVDRAIFIEEFRRFTHDAFEGWDDLWNNTIVAGGSVLTCIKAYALTPTFDDALVLPFGAAPAAHPTGPFSAMEEARRTAKECEICNFAPASCTFNCHHKTCSKCAAEVQICPFCRAAITTRTNAEAPLSSSDIDIFLWGISASEATTKLSQVGASICVGVRVAMRVSTAYVSQIHARLATANGGRVLIVRTSNAITFAMDFPRRHVQVILRLYLSPAEILLGFDVDCSAVIARMCHVSLLLLLPDSRNLLASAAL
jgi:hypothetical protein